MKIIVCLKEVVDSKVNLVFHPETGELFRKGLAYRLNPDDITAMALALKIKGEILAEIVLITIGTENVEHYLRQGLACGADSAIRIWGKEMGELSSYQKARVLARAIYQLAPDLVLTGVRSLDTATGQVGLLIAGWLEIPCVVETFSLQVDREEKSVTAVRDVGKGTQERVRCHLPAVVTIKGAGSGLPYASLENILKSRDIPIKRLSPADLGISSEELGYAPIRVTGLAFPKPRTRKAPMPESTMPTYNRILMLLQGGLTKRQGKILKGSNEELVNQLYELLVAKGVIKADAK